MIATTVMAITPTMIPASTPDEATMVCTIEPAMPAVSRRDFVCG